MKILRVAFPFIFLALTSVLFAQPAPSEWVPRSLGALGQNASSRTEFTLDHSMLVFASKLDQDDQDLRRVIAGVDGVSVHEFHFHGPAGYDPQTLSALRAEYHAAGWKRIANPREKDGRPIATELWLKFENNAIRDIAVLHTGGTEVDFVNVSGSISPIDLLHLAGHFGIPRIEGGVPSSGN